jgi:hypothetical protein
VLLGLAWGGWTLGQRLLQPLLPPPQEIFVLGGDLQREEVAAQLASYSHLPVLVSGGSNPEYARWLFGRHGLDPNRVTLDYRARDTLSNFTTVVDGLRARGVRHLLLVTSSDHMACRWCAFHLAQIEQFRLKALFGFDNDLVSQWLDVHSCTLRVYLRLGFGSVISRTGSASISGTGSAYGTGVNSPHHSCGDLV